MSDYDGLIEEVKKPGEETYYGIPVKKDDKGMLYHEVPNGGKRYVMPDSFRDGIIA